MTQLVPLCLLSVLGAACAPDEPLLVSEDTAELGDRGKTLIQPGTDQILLAVTDDNFAVYQEGHAIFATKLRRGAARSFVGEVPATNIAQVLQVGKVVFVWTDPQRDLPGLGVSPLLLWTAREGTQLLSAQSAVRLVATAASSDRRQVVFTTHVTDDGLRGDLVHAFTGDALHPTDPARRHPAELSVGAVPAARELRPRSRARGPGRRVLRRHRHDGDAVEVGRHHEARSAREHRDALVVRARERCRRDHIPGQPRQPERRDRHHRWRGDVRGSSGTICFARPPIARSSNARCRPATSSPARSGSRPSPDMVRAARADHSI